MLRSLSIKFESRYVADLTMQLNIDIIIHDYAANKHYYTICSKETLLSCNPDLPLPMRSLVLVI